MVVVCGEALIDRIPGTDSPGGGPYNTARALARLGIPTQFLGRLSTDALGRRLRDLLAADGADLSLTSFGPEPSTLAIADVDPDGHAAYRFIIDGTSAPNLTRQMLPASLSSGVRALHVGTLGLVFEPIAPTIAGLVEREHENLLVMVDPNIRAAALNGTAGYRARLERIIAESTIVKASDADMAWLYPEVELVSAARALLAHGPSLVVVTLGADGAFGVCAGTEVRVPAPMVDVVDTIGAGDAFGAGLLAWLFDHDRLSRDLHLEREELGAALEFACLVASITCTRAGADPPRRTELHFP
ncbi:MAG TPA: carbohydrate kinase [Candidatus Dormibacteraeota bacterium]|nr:carbohydrate kinase [Candidatus Dormibacteraeota bacterium]